MAKTLIAFFTRADENYFGGAMRYVKVGNTEIVVGLLPLKKAEVAEREKSLPRQVLQVEDPVWVWTIKYRRVAAFLAWLPVIFVVFKIKIQDAVKRGFDIHVAIA